MEVLYFSELGSPLRSIRIHYLFVCVSIYIDSYVRVCMIRISYICYIEENGVEKGVKRKEEKEK